MLDSSSSNKNRDNITTNTTSRNKVIKIKMKVIRVIKE